MDICLLLFSMILLCAEKVKSQNQGDLRLAQQDIIDGSFTAGRLEIYMNSMWGSICADNFDMIDADVACRQLGYFGALEVETSFHTPYGRGMNGPVWLDEVNCNDADLLHILSCSHVDVQENDCDHFSDVAVKCMDQPQLTRPNDLDLRIVRGDFKSQGALEVHCNGTWAPVCPPQGSMFGKAEGDAVCRQLGYTEATQFWTSSLELKEETPTYTQELECPEGASNIESCGGTCGASEDSLDAGQTLCVFIECAHTVPYGSLRLSQGPNVTPDSLEGRLEIFYDGKWDSVCLQDFDFTAANVSCKQLGFVKALNYTRSVEGGFGEGETGSVSLSATHCTPEDSTLIYCASNREQGNCSHLEDVAVFCTNVSTVEPTTDGLDTNSKVFSLETFIAVIVGACLFFAMFFICLAVYRLHFALVPYDTLKEQSAHGLYFTEYEGSSLTINETNLDEKLPELFTTTTTKQGESKQKELGKPDTDLSEKQKWYKKRYITMKTKSPLTLTSPPVVPHDRDSKTPPHPQDSFSYPTSDISLPTAIPIPPPLVVKRRVEQEKTHSTRDSPSGYPATTLPTMPPEHNPRQGARRFSGSRGSDKRLPPGKPEPYNSLTKMRSSFSEERSLPPKPEPYNGLTKTRSSFSEERSLPAKPEPYNGLTKMASTGSDNKLPPGKPEAYKGIRKMSQSEMKALEGTSNFDGSAARVILRRGRDQPPTLDATAGPNSSGSSATQTRHDSTHRVSFKLE